MSSKTVSTTTLDGSDIDVDQMLKRADTALYAAKAAGRNNCQMWHEEHSESGLLRRVLKAGQITFNGGRSTIECTIRGLSKSGAIIQVISTAGVPERFKLGVVSEDLHRMCKMVSTRDNQMKSCSNSAFPLPRTVLWDQIGRRSTFPGETQCLRNSCWRVWSSHLPAARLLRRRAAIARRSVRTASRSPVLPRPRS